MCVCVGEAERSCKRSTKREEGKKKNSLSATGWVEEGEGECECSCVCVCVCVSEREGEIETQIWKDCLVQESVRGYM